MLGDAVDTYYEYVVQQMQKINPAFVFGGIANARGWPQTTPASGEVFLLVLKSVPTLNDLSTRSQRLYEEFCQWVWILVGNDLQAAQEGQNRGDVYRTDFLIQEQLRQANYPGFTQKMSFAA